ncbi:MAG: hypothetical protein HXS46_09645 [Theionarchaea archaeon]|nr:hypothetical protein [Theionarchaea archaeon]
MDLCLLYRPDRAGDTSSNTCYSHCGQSPTCGQEESSIILHILEIYCMTGYTFLLNLLTYEYNIDVDK